MVPLSYQPGDVGHTGGPVGVDSQRRLTSPVRGPPQRHRVPVMSGTWFRFYQQTSDSGVFSVDTNYIWMNPLLSSGLRSVC